MQYETRSERVMSAQSHLEKRPDANARLERMMAEHGDALLRLCYLYLSDRMLAEDALQETFIKAYLALDGFHGGSSEKTWLTRIAINTCKDCYKKAWFKQRLRAVSPEEIPEPTVDWEPSDDTVLREVRRLPLREREIVLLRYYQNMRTTEISALLGLPNGTVASRLNRARAKLHRRLEGWYLDE